METNYNEKLRNESIASVYALLEYAGSKMNMFDAEDKKSEAERDKWVHIFQDCQQELDLRTKQIFG